MNQNCRCHDEQAAIKKNSLLNQVNLAVIHAAKDKRLQKIGIVTVKKFKWKFDEILNTEIQY